MKVFHVLFCLEKLIFYIQFISFLEISIVNYLWRMGIGTICLKQFMSQLRYVFIWREKWNWTIHSQMSNVDRYETEVCKCDDTILSVFLCMVSWRLGKNGNAISMRTIQIGFKSDFSKRFFHFMEVKRIPFTKWYWPLQIPSINNARKSFSLFELIVYSKFEDLFPFDYAFSMNFFRSKLI